MNKTQQSAYHNILQGFQNMADEILIPAAGAGRTLQRIFPAPSGSPGDLLGHRISLQILSGFSEPDFCAGIPV